jgi:hypothetical protein
MKKYMIFILISIILIILMAVMIVLSNPHRKSEERIRKAMLELTPIGTSMENVIKLIESHKKWKIKKTSYEHGYGIDKWGTPGENRNIYIGVKSIKVYLGCYGIIINTSVTVYWGFDEDGNLIDIAVRKDKNVL